MLHSIGKKVVTKDIVDRDSERVLPLGAKTDNFVKNPIMLFNHMRPSIFSEKALPIGKWDNIEISDNEITMEGFVSDSTQNSKDILALAQDGILGATSMGFRPIKWSDDTKDKLPGQKGLTITEYELFEVSLVDIPSNPDAVGKVKSLKGEESEEKIYSSVKSWMENGQDGIVCKSVNYLNMSILSVVNKYLGTSFGDDAKPQDVEKAFETFSTKGVSLEAVQKALSTFDGEVKSLIDEKIEALNVKALQDEVESLKGQLAELQTTEDAPESDGETLKDKAAKTDGVEVIDARKWFNLQNN